MKLLEQILEELGADTLKSFSVVPGFGGYFRSVKGVVEYAPEKIVIALKKNKITVTGENLTLGKYFEEDLLIRGAISGVTID
ncbi:MAG: YabP/YqfC family sporulation protein [Clostridia bacterium]|nr:YabP/YqfC family sporulation protein [Clostridia bacterium]